MAGKLWHDPVIDAQVKTYRYKSVPGTMETDILFDSGQFDQGFQMPVGDMVGVDPGNTLILQARTDQA